MGHPSSFQAATLENDSPDGQVGGGSEHEGTVTSHLPFEQVDQIRQPTRASLPQLQYWPLSVQEEPLGGGDLGHGLSCDPFALSG